MNACEHCRNLLLDHGYGLLEEADAQALTLHLESCPSCQAAFARVQADMARLARAARPIPDVPLFQPPEETTTPPPAVAPSVAVPAAPRVALWRAYWPALAVLAASLLMVISLTLYYQTNYQRLEDALAQKKSQEDVIDKQLKSAETKFKRETHEKAVNLKDKRFIQVKMEGSPNYNPSRHLPVRITTSTLEGFAATTPVLAQVVDKAESNKVLFETTVACNGETQLNLPAGLKPFGKETVLIVKAGDGRVQEKLEWQPAAHLLHLLCDKSIYLPGELLFFRVLALERSSLRPPTESLGLKAMIVDAQGNPVLDKVIWTTPSGIAADSFALPAEIGYGYYTVLVTGSSDAQVQPTHRILEVMRETRQFVEANLDNLRATSGSDLQFNFKLNEQGKPLANKAVNGTYTLEENPSNYGRNISNNAYNTTPSRINNYGQNQTQQKVQNPFNIQTNSKGEGSITVHVPENWPSLNNRLQVDINSGKNRQQVTQNVEVMPREWTVDFFPEGGELLANVPNRLYFRVQTPLGEPLQPEGTIKLLSSKEIFTSKEAAGAFAFTPSPEEEYFVEIAPVKGPTKKVPAFPNLPIRIDGLGLHVPEVVAKAGAETEIILHNQHAARSLLVTAVCRGQLVDYKQLQAGKGENRLTLKPSGEGIVRLTVYDLDDKKTPLAERLIFRLPAKPMDLAADFGMKQAEGYTPNQTVEMEVTSKNLSTGVQAWSTACVADARFCAEKKEPSLASHFLILDDWTAGEDLEDAHLVVSDRPDAKKSLDLFLSTQGWRRFVPDVQIAGQPSSAKAAPVFFSRQNETGDMRRSYEKDLEIAVNLARTEWIALSQQLLPRKDNLSKETAEARTAFLRFQQRPYQWLVWGIFLIFAFLLLTGAFYYVKALIGWLGKREHASLAFGKGFAYLTAALILFLMRGEFSVFLENPKIPSPGTVVWPTIPETHAILEANKLRFPASDAKAAGRVYPLAPEAEVGQVANLDFPRLLMDRANKKADKFFDQEIAKQVEMLAQKTLGRSRNEDVQTNSSLGLQNSLIRDFYQEAFRQQQMYRNSNGSFGNVEEAGKNLQAKGAEKTDPINPANPTTNPAKTAEQKAMVREYVHRRLPGLDAQETLLWKPILPLVNGAAKVDFQLSGNVTNYRVLLFGHTSEGNLGYYEGALEVKKLPVAK